MKSSEVWLSWLERVLHMHKVAGSSPAISTKTIISPWQKATGLLLFLYIQAQCRSVI